MITEVGMKKLKRVPWKRSEPTREGEYQKESRSGKRVRSIFREVKQSAPLPIWELEYPELEDK